MSDDKNYRDVVIVSFSFSRSLPALICTKGNSRRLTRTDRVAPGYPRRVFLKPIVMSYGSGPFRLNTHEGVDCSRHLNGGLAKKEEKKLPG